VTPSGFSRRRGDAIKPGQVHRGRPVAPIVVAESISADRSHLLRASLTGRCIRRRAPRSERWDFRS